MSCKFCEKIWANKDEYRNQFKYDWDEEIAIVLDEDLDGKPALYIPIDDYYYSDTYLQINFCPICGRRLTEIEGKRVLDTGYVQIDNVLI